MFSDGQQHPNSVLLFAHQLLWGSQRRAALGGFVWWRNLIYIRRFDVLYSVLMTCRVRLFFDTLTLTNMNMFFYKTQSSQGCFNTKRRRRSLPQQNSRLSDQRLLQVRFHNQRKQRGLGNYTCIFISCSFIHRLHYLSEGNTVLFNPLHLSDSYSI